MSEPGDPQRDEPARSEVNFRALLDSLAIGVVVGMAAKVMYVNDAACALLGNERSDDVVGRETASFIHGDSQPILAKRKAAMDLNQPLPADVVRGSTRTATTCSSRARRRTRIWTGRTRWGGCWSGRSRGRFGVACGCRGNGGGSMHDRVSDVLTGERPASTIVVVEDEAIIAADIERILVGFGYRVPPSVASADAAIEAVETYRPDLVLMDVKLSGDRDGIEAAARIRDQFGLPVVYLTSYSDELTLARAKKTMPFGYVIKPFSERELRTAIEVALHKHAAEAKLLERERWFATTLRSIGDAVIATDRDERITFMNHAAEILTTWTAEEALGRKLSEVFRVVQTEERRLESSVARRLGDGFSVALPQREAQAARVKRGIVVEDSMSPVLDHRGTLLGGVVVFRDITERRRLEQRLAASERLASLGSVTANMAHEINNPLTYVTINLSLAKDLAVRVRAGRGSEESRAADLRDLVATLEDAQEGAQRVLQLAREIRKVSRAEGPTDKRVLDLPDVLDVAVKLTHHIVTPATR
ncbi:MAG: PAS domain S-box protein, partial [Myxococcales bacterium]|nr:PAS domain S-box protein [Myxococcales bacterium]